MSLIRSTIAEDLSPHITKIHGSTIGIYQMPSGSMELSDTMLATAHHYCNIITDNNISIPEIKSLISKFGLRTSKGNILTLEKSTDLQYKIGQYKLRSDSDIPLYNTEEGISAERLSWKGTITTYQVSSSTSVQQGFSKKAGQVLTQK